MTAILQHAAFAALVWFGFAQGMEGAANVVRFLTWAWLLLMLVGFVCVTIAPAAASKIKTPPAWQRWITRALAVGAVAVLVWFGASATAVAYVFGWLFGAGMVAAGRRERSA